MTIEQTPIIDNVLRTITVTDQINVTEDVWVTINGALGLTSEDITIDGNIITIPEAVPVDFLGDVIVVLYTTL